MQRTGAKNSAHLVMMAVEKGELLLQRCARVRYVPERDIEACELPVDNISSRRGIILTEDGKIKID